jgi:hypothetical protein
VVEILHTCVWKWKMELFQEWEEGRLRRMRECINSIMIYCWNFYKYHNVPPVQQ